MPLTLPRRDFLLGAAGLGLASGLGLAASGFPHASRAAEPDEPPEVPQFRFSLAAYSYRELLSGEAPELTLADFIADCLRFKLDGTELTSYYFPTPVTAEYVTGLQQQCAQSGLEVSGTAVGNDFGWPPGERRDRELAHVKAWVDWAVLLGAPVIRIFAGNPHEGLTPEEAHPLYVAGIEECCAYAGERKIRLALENHGGPTATAEGLLRIVRDVQSPWLGVNLDTGNFHSADLYGELAAAAPLAINVQVKVVVSGPDGQQPSDYPRLAQILRDAGYRGFVVLEYEEEGDPREECPKHLEQLREAFA